MHYVDNKLFNLLSSTNQQIILKENFIENIYYQYIQLQIQINHANRQINQCRNIFKIDHIQINDQQPTTYYFKLLADLLTIELISLSGIMQQQTNRLLTINSPNETTIYYNRLLSIEYIIKLK
ncbi:unnamed protein product [Rotaria sp. Silwood2]|nr:unnamed protein product [Rotaria sp. Silwood2]